MCARQEEERPKLQGEITCTNAREEKSWLGNNDRNVCWSWIKERIEWKNWSKKRREREREMMERWQHGEWGLASQTTTHQTTPYEPLLFKLVDRRMGERIWVLIWILPSPEVVGLSWWVVWESCVYEVYLNKLMAVDSFFLPSDQRRWGWRYETMMNVAWCEFCVNKLYRWWISIQQRKRWRVGGWIVKRDDFPLMIRKKDKVGRRWEFGRKSAQKDTPKEENMYDEIGSTRRMLYDDDPLYSSLLWSTL